MAPYIPSLATHSKRHAKHKTNQYTVWWRYNAVDFLQNHHKRHPIARPLGRDMGFLLWVQTYIHIPPQSPQWCVQYHIILDRVITALDCTSLESVMPPRLILNFQINLLHVCICIDLIVKTAATPALVSGWNVITTVGNVRCLSYPTAYLLPHECSGHFAGCMGVTSTETMWAGLRCRQLLMYLYIFTIYICDYMKHTLRLTSRKQQLLQWCNNGRDGFSNHQPHDCLRNRLIRHRSKKNIKAPRRCILWGEFTGDRWIARTKDQ